MSETNKRMIGASVAALFVGIIVGMLVGQVFPGTAGNNDDDEDTNIEETTLYFEETVEDVSVWLQTTYADIAPDVTTTEQTLWRLNETPTTDPREVGEEIETDTDFFLAWTQAALDGLPADRIVGLDGSPADIELSKSPEITACLGVNDDPFGDTSEDERPDNIVVYLEVPVGEDKNIPRDWEPIEPRSATDMFWIVVDCNPDPDDAAAE